MSKKAQGISMNVIVIAAIALLVLVVLVLIFTGRIGTFSEGIKKCSGYGGFCVTGAFPGCQEATQDINGDGTGDGKLITTKGPIDQNKFLEYNDPSIVLYGDDIGCSSAQSCCVGLRN